MQGPAPKPDPPSACDVVVVGAGIVGLAVARELLARHPGTRLTVLEREEDVGRHQTGHSSGVIHAGIYYEPGSLKAQLCVEGARLLYDYCDERGIEARKEGKLILAAGEEELPRLDELERRGKANKVPGLRRIDAEKIPEIEPHARGIAALHSPATGVVDFLTVTRSFAADIRAAGGDVATGVEVKSTRAGGEGIEIGHSKGATTSGFAVFCAGAWADRLAVAAGADSEPRIVPIRGAYLKLRPERRELVKASIYPTPDPDLPFLGAHLTRTIDGEVLLGPSAMLVGARDAYSLTKIRPGDVLATAAWTGTWRLARRFWRYGLAEMGRAASRRLYVREMRRYVPELSESDTVPGPSGIRAQALGRNGALLDDFLVSRTRRALHVRNAPSPAATSSLALAKLIADQVEPEL
jgi:L-2-hydroxyglutarate oxidase